MKINDLRKLRDLSPRRARRHTKGKRRRERNATMPWPHGDARSTEKVTSFLVPFAAFCGQSGPGFFQPLFPLPIPLQYVNEQAPERLSFSILPQLDGNASINIQLFSAPALLFCPRPAHLIGIISKLLSLCCLYSLYGRARLRRAVTLSHEIELRLDGVSPYLAALRTVLLFRRRNDEWK